MSEAASWSRISEAWLALAASRHEHTSELCSSPAPPPIAHQRITILGNEPLYLLGLVILCLELQPPALCA